MIARALCLRQPWASLVATGRKRLESRSWSTPYRGPLVVTASARVAAEDTWLAAAEPFRSALADQPIDLPAGAAIAVVDLIGCVPTGHNGFAWLADPEQAFGDFSPGRFAWGLARRWLAPEPLAVRSTLGVFRLELPDDHPIAVEYARRAG